MGSITARAERPHAVPVEQLVEAILDLDGWQGWFDLHGGWLDGVPPRPVAGALLRQRVVIHGVGDDVTWVVRESRLPQQLVLEGTGTYGSTVSLRFGVGSSLSCELGVRGPWPAPASLKRIAGRTMELEIERALMKLELHVRSTRLGEALTAAEQGMLEFTPPPPKLFSVATRMLGVRS
jgi:hypothetical protein